MSRSAWIERRQDPESGRYYRAVFSNGRFVKSYWRASDALEAARELAEVSGLPLHQAQVVPFERRGAAQWV